MLVCVECETHSSLLITCASVGGGGAGGAQPQPQPQAAPGLASVSARLCGGMISAG